MKINYNASAVLASNSLANNDDLLANSLERLSSGLKINRAKDNPAGLAMANRMNAQLEGLSKANRNAGDGVSIIETADGAMTEISEMLQRMNELAVKSANGLKSDTDRGVIQDEVRQLKEEITRVAESTEFNGQRLLNGQFSKRGYTNDTDIKVQSYSMDVAEKIYNIQSLEIGLDPLTNKYTVTNFQAGDGLPPGTTASMENNIVTIQGPEGFELKLDLTDVDLSQVTQAAPLDVVQGNPEGQLQVHVTGIGAMRLQIGANEGQVLEVDIPRVSLRDMGIEDLEVTSKDSATAAIDRIDGAIQYVSSVRGRLGAYQNRLESTINSLDVTTENMTGAYSRIMDVDMAEEMTTYTSQQVLTQAGTSMLAQANERPSQVLQLLQ